MFHIDSYKQINIDRNTESKIPNPEVAGSNPAGCTNLEAIFGNL
jgi:hypothetical protein